MKALWSSPDRKPVEVSMLSFDFASSTPKVLCVLRTGDLAGSKCWIDQTELSYSSSQAEGFSPFAPDFSTLALPDQLRVVARIQSARIKANEERLVSTKIKAKAKSKAKPKDPLIALTKQVKANPEMLKLLQSLIKP